MRSKDYSRLKPAALTDFQLRRYRLLQLPRNSAPARNRKTAEAAK